MTGATPGKPSFGFASWRVGSVSLLALSSGWPLGLVLFTMPTWLTASGVDIKTVGLMTLAQAPYAFKFVWAPLMDRYWPPFLGRKRGWILTAQLTLSAAVSALAWVAIEPTLAMVAGLMLLISFASASQDIAYDAYAVEVLEPGDYGAATGLRTGLYRVAMWVSGNLAISLGPSWGWRTTFGALAVISLGLVGLTLRSAEPATAPAPLPRLRDAVWLPLVGLLARARAVEIACFVFFYKLADNLAAALIRPFLTLHGYSEWDVGVGSGVVVMLSASVGTLLGGLATHRLGMTRALWLFGVAQGLSNLGYAVVAAVPVNRWVLYVAMGVENATSGLGSAAFGILLLKLTSKRFSATQFALLTSLFALGRTVCGPPAGALAEALGWRDFFVLSIPAAVPGLVLLHRFAPWAARDSTIFEADAAEVVAPGPSWSTANLWAWGLGVGAASTLAALMGAAGLTVLRDARAGLPVDWAARLLGVVTPHTAAEAIDAIGAVLFGALAGGAVAAFRAARGRPLV